jgi:hypothetical protein
MHVKPGKINLKLTGATFFDLAGTDVAKLDSTKVACVVSGQAFSFTAVSGDPYFLEILHGGMTDDATGELQEDCSAPKTLLTLSSGNTFARLKVVVSGGGQ